MLSGDALKSLIVDNSKDCIKVLGLDGKLLFLAQNALKEFGVSDFKEIAGTNWLELWSGENKRAVTEAFEQAKRGETGEFTGVAVAGETQDQRWWNIVFSPMYDDQEKLVSILAVSRDVSAREHQLIEFKKRNELDIVAQKKLLLDLQQSKEELDIILHGVTDGITVLDPEGKFVYANDRGAKLCGYASAAEFLKATTAEIMAAFEIMDEDGKPLDTSLLPGRQALQGVRNPPEKLIKSRTRKTGEVRWCIVNAAPVFDEFGKVRYGISIFKDVTERRRAEEALKLLARSGVALAASLDYRETLQSIAALVVPSLADWCTIAVKVPEKHTPEIVATTHADPGKLRWAKEIQLKYPSDWNAPRGMGNVIRTGKSEFYPLLTDELIKRSAHDSEHLRILREVGMYSVIIVPLKARDTTLGALTLISAEAGRQYSEADLKVAEDLGYRAGLAVESALLYKKAQESIEARNEFLSIASHELKTPITSLKMQLEMARQKIEPGFVVASLPVNLLRMFDVTCRQVDRLTALVEDMLDVSRIQAGKLALTREQMDLSTLVSEICDRYREAFERERSVLTVDLAKHVIGYWDSGRIEQVVVNLLTNALKYAAGAPIHVSVSLDGANAYVVVADLGPGIEAARQAAIFERFERANASRDISGLGLGLFIVRQILQAHEGAIRVESAPGQGTKFIVELPLTRNSG